MNERIQKLAKDARHAVDQEGILLELVLEKFAELIISECRSVALGEIVRDSDIDAESDLLVKEYLKGNNGGVVDSIVAIQQHFFGVEE